MRLLFVLGRYYPKPSANGVCVLRVQEALAQRGVLSDVVADGDVEETIDCQYGKLYTGPIVNVSKLSTPERLAAAARYPLYFPSNIKWYGNTIDRALSENCYDAIIAVLRPLDGAFACAKYTNMLIYELDSVSNNDDNEHGYRRFLRPRTLHLEQALYEKASYIFHMYSHKAHYSHRRYQRFAHKSAFLDIPQMVDEKIEDRAVGDGDPVKILYSGILTARMRSPEYAITLMKELIRQGAVKAEMNFYSRGNCEDMLEEAQRETEGAVHQHGYVSLEELNAAVGETDFLLSIGNTMSGKVTSLPSKVISYMSYGKPIIHIDGGRNDTAKEYLAKYPLVLVIDPAADLQENVKKLQSFLENSIGKRVPFTDIERIFERNTPDYTAEHIIKAVSSRCIGTVIKREK